MFRAACGRALGVAIRNVAINPWRSLSTLKDTSRYVGMTGAQVVHDSLREHAVEIVFGYPGGAILPVYDAIHESPHFKARPRLCASDSAILV